MAWCCSEFAKHVDAASGIGLRVVYVYQAKLGKLYVAHCGSAIAEGSQIYFCPWCGSDLANWPKPTGSFPITPFHSRYRRERGFCALENW
jgi:hypothetical protein